MLIGTCRSRPTPTDEAAVTFGARTVAVIVACRLDGVEKPAGCVMVRSVSPWVAGSNWPPTMV